MSSSSLLSVVRRLYQDDCLDKIDANHHQRRSGSRGEADWVSSTQVARKPLGCGMLPRYRSRSTKVEIKLADGAPEKYVLNTLQAVTSSWDFVLLYEFR